MEGLCELERPQDAVDLFQQIGTLRQQIDIDNEPSSHIKGQRQQQQQQPLSEDIHELNIMTVRTPEPIATLPSSDDDILDDAERETVSIITDSDEACHSLDGSSNRQHKNGMSLQTSFQR